MNQERGVRTVTGYFFPDGLLQNGDFLRHPDIVLVAEENQICVRLADQRKEIPGSAEMTAGFTAGGEPGILPDDTRQDLRRPVCGTVVLDKNGKIRIRLGTQGVQQLRKMLFPVVSFRQPSRFFQQKSGKRKPTKHTRSVMDE